MSLMLRNNLFDIDRFFSDAWPQRADSGASGFFSPRVDIRDVEDHYAITAELPGVSKEDIHIYVKEGVLTLEAETRHEDRQEKEGTVIRQERRYGKFMRSFSLGNDVEESDIKASFVDGVLTLQAPKLVERAIERRRIEVS